MSGRFNIGNNSGGSGSRQSSEMAMGDKIKIGVAAGIVLLGGLWVCYYTGMFDNLLRAKPDPNVPIVDGKPVPAAEVEEFQRNAREYQKANEEKIKTDGPPAGS